MMVDRQLPFKASLAPSGVEAGTNRPVIIAQLIMGIAWVFAVHQSSDFIKASVGSTKFTLWTSTGEQSVLSSVLLASLSHLKALVLDQRTYIPLPDGIYCGCGSQWLSH
jgi:hypothetical protein